MLLSCTDVVLLNKEQRYKSATPLLLSKFLKADIKKEN